MIAKSHYVRVGRQSFDVFPSQPETAQALWAALPPDLRLALAKTAPRVLGPRVTQKCKATGARIEDTCGREIRAHYEDDAALRAQGYVLDGDTP
jgi:hypothetical protein